MDATSTSAFSNIANAVTTLAAPSGVTGTEANGSNRAQQVNLTWTDNDASVATAYDIYRSTLSSSGFTQLNPGTVGAGATAYTDTTAFPSTTYYYEVEAVNAITTSAFSGVSSAVVMPTNEVGAIVTDYWYDNGVATNNWVGQWTQTNQTTNATPLIKYNTSNQGKAKFTSLGGTMSGNYIANINTTTFVDSYQSVLINSDTTGTNFQLVARTAATTDATCYNAELVFAATGNNLIINSKVSGTNTVVASFNVGAIATNTWYDLEFEVVTANSTATDLNAKVWNVTAATEPTTWQISTTDSATGLRGVNGNDGMRFALASAAENTFLVDNYEAVNLVSSSASYINNFQNSSTTGWSPLTASRWSVGTQGNATTGYSVRYYINTSSYAEGTNSTLGEYSLLNASGETNIGDFNMTVDVTAGGTSTTGTGSNYAIVFGYQSTGNYYFMEFNAISGATALYKVVGGATPSLIATATGGQITDTLSHAIQIQRTGTSITVWYDGNQILSTTDATFIGGQIGLGALNDAAYFDNVIIG